MKKHLLLIIIPIIFITTFGMKSYFDIPYVQIPETDIKLTSLDIYTPDATGNNPVIFYIHGGAWFTGDKKNIYNKHTYFTSKNFIVVSINYRLTSTPSFDKKQKITNPYPVHIKDTASAFRWVYDNIKQYGGDNKNIFVIGHSAGAHLAALLSTNEKYLKEQKLDLNNIKGTAALDGAAMDIESEMSFMPFFLAVLYTNAFSEDPEIWKDASPLQHIDKDKNIPPFLIVPAGTRRDSKIMSYKMKEKFDREGLYCEVYHAWLDSHLSLNMNIGKSGDETTKIIMNFLNRFIKYK